MPNYIGIDPGLNGGIASINNANDLKGIWLIPTFTVGTKKEIDTKSLYQLLKPFKDNCKLVGIETQHAMPKQGVSSMFKIGKGYGIIIGILTALELPYIEIRSLEWQKVMFAGLDRTNTKDLSKIIAQRLHPKCEFKASKRCTKIHDGMTDAVMIAHYTKLKAR